jgi:hypothetical protein
MREVSIIYMGIYKLSIQFFLLFKGLITYLVFIVIFNRCSTFTRIIPILF